MLEVVISEVLLHVHVYHLFVLFTAAMEGVKILFS